MTSSPRYQKVKELILAGIASSRYKPGDRVPSENELARRCNVSRMTARRALDELTKEGTLTRTRGSGTFVADIRHRSSLLKIRNLATEIQDRQQVHTCITMELKEVAADEKCAAIFQIDPGEPLYHSVLLHKENNVAIQLEDRYVAPHIAVDYLNLDFSQTTPHLYLSAVAPISEAEHVIEAIMPDQAHREALEMGEGEPCLLLNRTTWCDGKVVSFARLYHPGDRYRLGSRFVPEQ